MRSKTSLTVMIFGALVTFGVMTAEVASAASGDKGKWACMKDGKTVKVKGKNKKKACEDQGGTWGKKGDDGGASDPADSFGTSSSSSGGGGGGGGW